MTPSESVSDSVAEADKTGDAWPGGVEMSNTWAVARFATLVVGDAAGDAVSDYGGDGRGGCNAPGGKPKLDGVDLAEYPLSPDAG